MPKKAMGLDALKQYSVNNAGQAEELTWSLYDFTAYAAAGQTSLNFFQSPIGQNGKTIVDTNMDLAGNIPKGQTFIVQSVCVEFFPGVDIEAAGQLERVNDIQAVLENGALIFSVGSKNFIEQAPLGQFPPQFCQEGFAAIGGADEEYLAYSTIKGEEYEIVPITLVSSQNFKVQMVWPTAIALPSTVNGRIGVRLKGRLFRNTQ